MAITQHTIRTIGDLLGVLPVVFGNPKKIVWFRGQASDRWKLLPSIMRAPNNVDDEMVLFKRFKQHSFPFLDRIPSEEWEWLFLMQHYGVSTRLLDFSESPLVGLYFALQRSHKAADRKRDAILWCIFPNVLNSLAGLTLTTAFDIPCFGDDKELDKYLPSQVIGISSAKNNPLAIIAPRQFKRLYAQQGVFILFHRNITAIEDLGDTHAVKLVVPHDAKDDMARELDYLMVNELALFPELEKVGKRIYDLQL